MTDEEMINFLERVEPNFEDFNDDEHNRLQIAINFNEIEIVERLIKRFNTDQNSFVNHEYTELEWYENDNSPTPIFLAINNLKILELLVNNGADIHKKNKYGYTILHKTITNKHLVKVSTYLIKKGLKRSNILNNIIHHEDIMLETIKLLIDNGANVNSSDCYDFECKVRHLQFRSVLHKALFYEVGFEKVKLLVENGANVNYKDSHGNSILQLVAKHVIEHDKLKYCELLIQYGADVKYVNSFHYDTLDEIIENIIDSPTFIPLDSKKIFNELRFYGLELKPVYKPYWENSVLSSFLDNNNDEGSEVCKYIKQQTLSGNQ
uniref:Uncharacterized protein n=1 Tax=viral metagenome TaxID=1070528 RepID=A0A6C0JSP3_9ZZZZ